MPLPNLALAGTSAHAFICPDTQLVFVGSESIAGPSAAGFVRASLHRSSAMLSLLDWPKTTGQIAAACGLSPAHASRAVRELVTRGLVEPTTPEIRGRGRLYEPTTEGRRVAETLDWDPRLRTPMVRGTHVKAWCQAIIARFGERRGMELMRDLNLVEVLESPSRHWIPLGSIMRLLDEIERRFGDGSLRVVQELASDSVQHYPSVRRYLFRALPWHVILETGPAAYMREFNHGRIEVEVQGNQALVKLFEWLSSPARCAGWKGVFEGILRLKGLEGRVEERSCMLRGDDYCGYLIRWGESASN